MALRETTKCIELSQELSHNKFEYEFVALFRLHVPQQSDVFFETQL